MFTTYLWPAEVQTFSVKRCHQPTRIAVERAHGYHVFVQSRGRSLRAVALAAVSLARRESCADFLEVSLQLLGPSEWKLTAFCGFFREETIIVLEARSILYAVRFAEGRYSLGRHMILSDNLALVLALCTGRAKQFILLSVMRRIFASGFRASFVPSFRWIPSESELFRRRKSFLRP